MSTATMDAERLRELTDAYDRMDPDARAGMLEVFDIPPDDRSVGIVVIAAAIVLGLYDYDGMIASMRRAAVGMPVPGTREIARWRRTIRGRS